MIKMGSKRLLAAVNQADSGVNLSFKLLSAIGIIIIVAGHGYKGGLSFWFDWFPIYSFNLALFVFISGYFYKEKHEESVLRYIWGRAKRLLIPAYLWNIAYGIFVIIMKNCGYVTGAEVNPYNLFIMPFVDGEAFQYNLGSWFVYPLFCVYVINILFRKLLSLIKLNNEYIILIVYLTVGVLGIQLSIESTQGVHGILLLLFRTMFFLPCFEFGRFYKAKLEKHDNLNSLAYFAILFAVQLILLTFFKNLEYTPSKCTQFENGCVVPYISAITGIAFWLRVSKLVAPVIKHWKPILLVADNTYSIMIHHLTGFMVVKWIFYLISCITPLFSDFNMVTMKETMWYFYMPNGVYNYAIIYLAGGIFFSVLIGIIQKKAWKSIKTAFTPSLAKTKK
ncbi:MAG: acyltransferase family protein [Ruminococcus sp.]